MTHVNMYELHDTLVSVHENHWHNMKFNFIKMNYKYIIKNITDKYIVKKYHHRSSLIGKHVCVGRIERESMALEALLHPVEFPNNLLTTGTRVDDIFTSINTKWNQAAPQPKTAVKEFVYSFI